MNVYNLKTGESKTIDLKNSNDMFDKEKMSKILKENNLDDSSSDLIFSKQKLENWLPKDVKKMVSETNNQSNIDYPKPPKPTGITVLPPTKSKKKIISTTKVNSVLNVMAEGGGYMPSNYDGVVTPKFPDVYLQYSAYWKQVGTAILNDEQKYTKSVSYKHGMSKTNSETLSAEVGVAYGALSAKLSATIGHSVTISDEKTITDTYSFEVGEGKTTVYILWQLIEEYLFVDSTGKPIHWSGSMNGMFSLSFPNKPRYNKSNIVYSDRTDFDS